MKSGGFGGRQPAARPADTRVMCAALLTSEVVPDTRSPMMSFGRVVVFQLVLVMVGVAGCTKQNPLDCSDGTCSDKAHPYCDKDGTVAGEPNTCIAASCSAPNVFVDCKGDTAVACNATGDGYTLTPCSMGCSAEAHGCNMCTPNGTYCTADGVQACGADGAPTTFEACAQGCVADPQPHCAHLVPRYLPSVCDTAATGDVSLPAATLGTDLDPACTGGVVQQTAAPAICVVRGKTITIDSGVTLKVAGTRLLALVADDSVSIHGVVDASADGVTSGPGGGSSLSGAGATTTNFGGGGAGFKTAGAPGANGTVDGGGASGGAVAADPAQLAVMVGGPRSEGGGGGGVILVACRGSVSVDGLIDVGGGGGVGGAIHTTTPVGGGGGGAGGYVVMQGWTVAITGKVYANGGGGGQGYYNGTGASGADGSRSATIGAQGGMGGGGNGGAGATKTTGAADGLHSGGGGGGGLGFLQTYTPANVTPTLTPQESSPDFQTNQTVQTQ
ncbi:MAG TPA: hypothetical protein VLT45_12460 [Kofleriaceae bacterium]|nr:hypothetical protein [Kofleriaceae bacterium]